MYTHSKCTYAEENESLSTRPEGRREKSERERDGEKKVGCRRSPARKGGRSETREREKEGEGGEEGRRKAEKMGDLKLDEEKHGERVQ